MKKPVYLVLRLVVLMITVVETLNNLSQNNGGFDKNWDKNTQLFGLILLPVVFIIVIGMMGFYILIASSLIDAPSWYRNPFTLKQIPQMWHLGLWIAFSYGLALFVGKYFLYNQVNGLGYLCIMTGLGGLSGLYLSKILYRKKMSI